MCSAEFGKVSPNYFDLKTATK